MSTETTTPITSKRIPWFAMVLSLLSAGVGHLYCGRIIKGTLAYLAWFVIPPACFIGAQSQPSTGVLVGLVLTPIIAVVVSYFYAAVDAFVTAKRLGAGYQLKDYNRTGIYVALILVWLVYPVVLMVGVRAFMFEAFYLPERSMAPGLLAGDRVLVSKLTWRKEFPERGDVIVFRNPEPVGGRIFVKRVVGVAGDRLVFDGKNVEVNGKQLERDRVPPESLDRIKRQIDGDVYYESLSGKRYQVMYGRVSTRAPDTLPVEAIVPRRSVFVMGDNRDRSKDSRHFGAIHVGDVIGYVDYNFFPAETWSRFGVYRD